MCIVCSLRPLRLPFIAQQVRAAKEKGENLQSIYVFFLFFFFLFLYILAVGAFVAHWLFVQCVRGWDVRVRVCARSAGADVSDLHYYCTQTIRPNDRIFLRKVSEFEIKYIGRALQKYGNRKKE